ncbi:hypothetical protein BC828DRAFT_402412 [Blastocladiella britannica]|nr:hypothetical protein BC828DRAFT_402412 [Blastocladiella britannica]
MITTPAAAPAARAHKSQHRRSCSDSALSALASATSNGVALSTLGTWIPEQYLDPTGHLRLPDQKMNGSRPAGVYPRGRPGSGSFNATLSKLIKQSAAAVATPAAAASTSENNQGYMNAIGEVKRANEKLAAEKAELGRVIDGLRSQLKDAEKDRASMQYEVQRQAEHVSRILNGEKTVKASNVEKDQQSEMLLMMQREINGGLALKEQLADARRRIQIHETFIAEQETCIKERDQIIQHQQYVIDGAKKDNAGLREDIRLLEFRIDEFRVLNIKMEKRMKVALTQEEEMIKATEAVVVQYEQLKKNMETKQEQYTSLGKEIDEARNLYSVLMSQKKQLQSDLGVMVKQRNEAIDKNRHLETTLLKKEREITELLDKVNETVKNYETQLEKKEEQMWAITERLNEEATQNKATMSLMEREKLTEMERRMETQSQRFAEEVTALTERLAERETTVKELQQRFKDIQSKQYEPRMERLKAIESDLKSRMEEYLLAEESLETGLICSKCLQFYRQPHSIIPCSHTFCKECVDTIKAENYDRIVCPECGGGAAHESVGVYRNESLESLTERFMRRKSLVMSMMSWIKVFKVFEPPRGK